MQWKKRISEFFTVHAHPVHDPSPKAVHEQQQVTIPSKSLAGRLSGKLAKKKLKRNRSEHDLQSRSRLACLEECEQQPNSIETLSRTWHVKKQKDKNTQDVMETSNMFAQNMARPQSKPQMSQAIPSSSLVGRVQIRKEHARLQLEKQEKQGEFAFLTKERVDRHGNLLTSRSLAGCVISQKKKDKDSTLSPTEAGDRLSKSLVGRLRQLSACTKAQMDRQGKADDGNGVLSATASTYASQLDESLLAQLEKDPKALDLASEMRNALKSRLEDRRVGVKTHSKTFLHSEGLTWLVDRQARFEEQKWKAEHTRACHHAQMGIMMPPFTPKYSRYEDNLLDWKASHTGNRIRDAGYIVQLSGKDGFKPHRKTNHVFRFNHAAIDRDLQKASQKNEGPITHFHEQRPTSNRSVARLLMVDELSRAQLKDDESVPQHQYPGPPSDLLEKEPCVVKA